MVGHRWSERTRVKTFLAATTCRTAGRRRARRRSAGQREALAHAESTDLHLVLVPDGQVLGSPSTRGAGRALGLRTKAEQPLYDLCYIVDGRGRRGLAAKVSPPFRGPGDGGHRGEAPGGRAGRARDRELSGVPEGALGGRPHPSPVAQAPLRGRDGPRQGTKRSASSPRPGLAVALRRRREIEARAVVVATGVSYRMLDARGAGRPQGAQACSTAPPPAGSNGRSGRRTWWGQPTRRGRRR